MQEDGDIGKYALTMHANDYFAEFSLK